MNPDELRSGFLRFFSERGHEICKSDLLIPENDPTLLFTPAGMNQFKNMFMGVGTLPFKRATTSQKCMRMPDLDNVGVTASHHTFFEMLGNFSFGDYFKKEAIAWSKEYLVGELGLDFKDLRFSVYTDDDESAGIWRKEMNAPAEHIYRFGEKDNFWPAEAPSKGPNGVCGPCSEIYVDLKGGCGKPDCSPECDCGRYVEVWNLVFTQFNRLDGGVLEPLPFKNIDTGMGFERLLRVLEGVKTNFDTTLFAPILKHICNLTGRTYGENDIDDVRMRRIADHSRAAIFGILDGAPPSNEKQGYVIRKVIRRAIMDGRNLGLTDLFLHTLVDPVASCMKNGYPELVEQKARLEREIRLEEERFAETYMQGSARLSVLIDDMEKRNEKVLSGQSAFLLYDTFGFPLDLAKRTLEEQGLSVDINGFDREMEAQRERARQSTAISAKVFDLGPLDLVKKDTPPTEFIRDRDPERPCKSTVLHILTDGGLVDSITEGTGSSLVLDRTPFYAEAGGQVFDMGRLVSDRFEFRVEGGVIRDGELLLHSGTLVKGTLKKGDRGSSFIDDGRRGSIERNHTATHLVHFALRKVLGDHVEQAGSLVEPERLRFDFHHGSAMKPGEIKEVQRIVNEKIRANLPVKTEIKRLDEARKQGAMALFGEKYGDTVRVVSIEDKEAAEISMELCGGTHVRSTGEIGGFRILSEESIAAGTRRIEAATGIELDRIIDAKLDALKEACELLKVPEKELVHSIGQLQHQLKEQRRELKKVRAAEAEGSADRIVREGLTFAGGLRFFHGCVEDIPIEELRKMSDTIRSQAGGKSGLILLSIEGGRVHIVAAFDQPFLEKGIKAGDFCRSIGKRLGGGGGGKPTMAQGQGKDPSKAAEALKSAVDKIAGILDRA